MNRSQRIVAGVLLVVILAAAWVGILMQDQPVPGRQKVSVGVVLPLSGTTARYGQWIANALEIAKDGYNSDPSKRYEISYIMEDDQGASRETVTAARKLISLDAVPLIFGTWSSSGVLAMAPVIQEAGVVLMADAISPRIRDAGDWIFRCVPDARLSLGVLEEPLTNSGHESLAIIYINNDFGLDLAEYVADIVEGTLPIVLREAYPAGTKDFRTLIEKIRKSGADSVFLAGYTEQGLFLQQKKQLELDVQIYASPSFENSVIVQQAEGGAEGVIYPNYFASDLDSPEMLAFSDKYVKRFGERPEGFGSSGYVGMQTVLLALDNAASLRPDDIRASLNALGTFPSLFSKTTYIDEKGDIRYPIFLKTVDDSKFVRLRTE